MMTMCARISIPCAFLAILFIALPATAASVPGFIRTATTDDCIALKAVHTACTAGETPIGRFEDSIIQTGRGADSPIAFLEEHACRGTVVSCTDPNFAKMLQAFITAAEEAGRQGGWAIPHITSLYRSPAAQAKELAAGHSKVGPCRSYHQYSLAADFNSVNLRRGLTPAIKWMRANAGRYGFAILNERFDPAHFQLRSLRVSQLPRGMCGRCNAPPTGKVQSCTGTGAGSGLVDTVSNAFSQMTRPLTDLLRPQSSRQTQPRSALPTIKGPDVYGTTTLPIMPTSPAAHYADMPPASFTSVSAPQTPDEILAQIAVGPPQATTTATTTRPLTADEIRRFYEEQVRLGVIVSTSSTMVTPIGLQPIPTPPYAGFFTAEELNQEPSPALIQYYYQILLRVSLALAEVSRILRNEPPSTVPTWSME